LKRNSIPPWDRRYDAPSSGPKIQIGWSFPVVVRQGPSDSPIPRLLTKEEAADLLGVSERTVHTIIQRKELRVVRISGLIKIDPEDLRKYIESAKS
jgi:excisionase family DNA binding protein